MFTKVLAAAVFAGVALAQTFSINTPPSLQQCQPAALTWVGGTAPFILAAIPEGQTTAPVIATIAENVSGSPYTWNVNVPQGTAITIRITDSLGNIAYSSGRTIQAGGTGCLTGASGSASASVSAVSSASSASAASSGSASSRPASSAPASSAPASSGPAGTSSAPASSAPQSSRPAASGAASSSSAAGGKAAFQIPVLALAGVGAFVFVGGFAVLA